MNEMTLKTKLGKRLKTLFKRIPENTLLFYDLCCDHGALGRAILETQPACQVIFNDIHPDIMARLDQQLIQLGAQNYQMAICPAEHIKLQPIEPCCVMLAGVGVEQCLTILKTFLTNPPTTNVHFIVSPATKVFYLRQFLIEHQINCLSDSTVTENNRTYEILEFDLSPANKTFDLFGDAWQASRQHEKHLKKIIQFYQAQLIQRSDNELTKKIVHGYQKKLKKIST